MDDSSRGEPRLPRRFGVVTVVGGGCYGGYYVRQLRRARLAGAVHWERLEVVDRDPGCAVFRDGGADLTPVVAGWDAWIDDALATALATPAHGSTATMGGAGHWVVPSPLMPHLGAGVLLRRARARWPARRTTMRAVETAIGTPWERAAPDATYASFATWTCPVNCIEPARCPHTRAARDWSFAQTLPSVVQRRRDGGAPLVGMVHQHCVHQAYGVGMFPLSVLAEGDRTLAQAGATGAAELLVASTSHCHGALAVVGVGGLGDGGLGVGGLGDDDVRTGTAAGAPDGHPPLSPP